MCIVVNNNGVMRACYSEKEVRLALRKEEMGCYFNYQEFQRKFRELMNKPVYTMLLYWAKSQRYKVSEIF